MYTVSCKVLGFVDCDFVAEGKNPHKVRDLVLDHARDEHPELLAGITMEQRRDIVHVIDTHIVEQAA